MCIYEHEEAYYRVLELYHILEMKMADELNLQPSSKTHEIYKRVNAKRIVAANIKATTQDSRKTNQFFFRNNEMNLLYTAIDAFMLNRQNKQMFLMEGEEGVGKTAIIEHFFYRHIIVGFNYIENAMQPSENKLCIQSIK